MQNTSAKFHFCRKSDGRFGFRGSSGSRSLPPEMKTAAAISGKVEKNYHFYT